MDNTELADKLMRKLWHRRTEILYAINVPCNHAFIGREIDRLLRVHASRAHGTYPGQLPPLLGIDLVPGESLRPGEWQLRDKDGTVRAFGTLDDLREE